jgi:hypothetical protein
VLVEQFSEVKQSNGGQSVLLTPEQQNWVRAQKMAVSGLEHLQHFELFTYHHPWRKYFWHFTSPIGKLRKPFDAFVMLAIIVNSMLIASAYFGEEQAEINAREDLGTIFAALFTLEAVIKVLGDGWRIYLSQSWNRFDLVLVVVTDAILINVWTSDGGGSKYQGVASVLRILRIARLFKLLHFMPALRVLFQAMYLTLPSIANMLGVLMIFYFIFAVMGVQAFAKVKLGEDFNVDANFQSLGSALILLLRCSTGEGWNMIMYDIADTSNLTYTHTALSDRNASASFPSDRTALASFFPATGLHAIGSGVVGITTHMPSEEEQHAALQQHGYGFDTYDINEECVLDPEFDVGRCGFAGSNPFTCKPLHGCGSPYTAYIFSLATQIFISIMLLNLFLIALLDGFDNAFEIEESNAEVEVEPGQAGLTERQYTNLCQYWIQFDPEPCWLLAREEFYNFFSKLPEPLGLGLKQVPEDIEEVLADYGISANESDMFEFQTLVMAQAKRLCLQSMNSELSSVMGNKDLLTEQMRAMSEAGARVTKRIERKMESTSTILQNSGQAAVQKRQEARRQRRASSKIRLHNGVHEHTATTNVKTFAKETYVKSTCCAMRILPANGKERHIGHVTTSEYLDMLDEYSAVKVKDHVAQKGKEKDGGWDSD